MTPLEKVCCKLLVKEDLTWIREPGSSRETFLTKVKGVPIKLQQYLLCSMFSTKISYELYVNGNFIGSCKSCKKIKTLFDKVSTQICAEEAKIRKIDQKHHNNYLDELADMI